ncbi:MAG: transcription antitermination protein NusB [Phycisphaerales bacterium]
MPSMTPQARRRLAFQVLFQIDAQSGGGTPDVHQILAQMELDEGTADRDRAEVAAIAQGAWQARRNADKDTAALAPGWPAHRQAAVDRAILRLAHYLLNTPTAPCAAPAPAVISDAVDLAREFSTEKSPAFVNALLDKVYKATPAGKAAAANPPVANPPVANPPSDTPPVAPPPAPEAP